MITLSGCSKDETQRSNLYLILYKLKITKILKKSQNTNGTTIKH